MVRLPDNLAEGTLRLRTLTESDLAVVTQHFNTPSVARWLAAVAQPFGAEAAKELLSHGAHPGENLRAIEAEDVVVGGLCLGTSLWYWLAPAFWRQGLMSRALTLALAAHFSRCGPPVAATCHIENASSRALLTSLGFSRSPGNRRMFFHGTQTSEMCLDFVLAPEQWHLLRPPTFTAGALTLRPAQQKDALTLAHVVSSTDDGRWAKAEDPTRFIENYRYRGPGRGLFVIVDDNRRSIGMALVSAEGSQLCFLPETEAPGYRTQVLQCLARDFPARS